MKLAFKNIKFPRGNYQADSFKTKTLYCPHCSLLNFLSVAVQDLYYTVIFNFLDDVHESQL